MNIVILLTSCVHVQYHSAQTEEARIEQYVKALSFYWRFTDYNIVYCDNSSFDITPFISENIVNSDRLEILSFQAEEDPQRKGKGYNEAGIIEYAINHSSLMKQSDHIVKITGRHIVKNINKLIPEILNDIVVVDVDLDLTYAHSYFFVGASSFFTRFFLPMKNLMNDSQGAHFEHVLAQAVRLWISEGYKFSAFKYPLYLIGTTGTTNESYKKPTIKRFFLIYVKYVIFKIKRLCRC